MSLTPFSLYLATGTLKLFCQTKLIMPVLESELKKHIASESFLSSRLHNPEKNKSLEKLASSLSVDDYPVLMGVAMK